MKLDSTYLRFLDVFGGESGKNLLAREEELDVMLSSGEMQYELEKQEFTEIDK